MTTAEVHEFLKTRISQIFEELGMLNGLEIIVSGANLERCANLLEEYLGLEGITNEFAQYSMEVDEYE